MSEAVQQKVKAAERRLDSLFWLLCRQPAEGSAAGAPGEVATLQDHNQRVSRLAEKKKRKRLEESSTYGVKDEDVSVVQDVSRHHL